MTFQIKGVSDSNDPIGDAIKKLELDTNTSSNLFDKKQDDFNKKTLEDFSNKEDNTIMFPDVEDVRDYTKYGVPVTPFNDYNKERALRQSNWEQASHALKQAGATIAGEAISGFGSIYEIMDNIAKEAQGEDADFSNEIMRLGQSIQDAVKENNPIYRENPNKAFDVGDFAWWMDNAPSVASSFGILIPAYGTIGLISKLGKVGKIGSAMSDIGKIIGMTDKTGDAVKYWSKLTGSASIMRNSENLKGAMQVHNTILNDATNLYVNMSDEEFNTNMANNPKLTNEFYKSTDKPLTKENVASFIASKSGWRNYIDNAGNLVFDMIQLAPLFRGFKTAGRTNINKTKILNANLKASAESQLSKTAGRFNELGYQLLKASPMEIVTEGIEEIVNAVSEKEGNYYGQYLMGKKGDSDYTERLSEYLQDPFVWEQGMWGAIGGAMFSGGARAINSIRNTMNDINDTHSTKARLDEIQGRTIALNRTFSALKDIANGINPNVVPGEDNTLSEQEIETFYNNTLTQTGHELGKNAYRHGNVNLLEYQLQSEAFRNSMAEKGGMPIEEVNNIADRLLKTVKNTDSAFTSAEQQFVTRDIDEKVKPIIINNLANAIFNKLEQNQTNQELTSELIKLKLDPLYQTLQQELIDQNINPDDVLNVISLDALQSYLKEYPKTLKEDKAKAFNQNTAILKEKIDNKIKEIEERNKDNKDFNKIVNEKSNKFSQDLLETNASKIVAELKEQELDDKIKDINNNAETIAKENLKKFDEAKEFINSKFEELGKKAADAKTEEEINLVSQELDNLQFNTENDYIGDLVKSAKDMLATRLANLKEAEELTNQSVEETETETIEEETIVETEDESRSRSFTGGFNVSNTNIESTETISKSNLTTDLKSLHNLFNDDNYYAELTDISKVKTLFDLVREYLRNVKLDMQLNNIPISTSNVISYISSLDTVVAQDNAFIEFLTDMLNKENKEQIVLEENIVEEITTPNELSIALVTSRLVEDYNDMTEDEKVVYNETINKVDIGDVVTIKVDPDLVDSAKGNNNERHIAIFTKNNVKIGHLMRVFSVNGSNVSYHNNMAYSKGKSWTDRLISLLNTGEFGIELKLLFELKYNIQDKKVLDLLLNNPNIQDLIAFNNTRYETLTEKDKLEAIRHITNVVTFKQETINVLDIVETVKNWNNTILTEMDESIKLRNVLNTIDQFDITVSYKTPGGIENTGELRSLNEVFGETTNDFNIPLLYPENKNETTLSVANPKVSNNTTSFINPLNRNYPFGVYTIINLGVINGEVVQKPVPVKVMTVGDNGNMISIITSKIFEYFKTGNSNILGTLSKDIIIEKDKKSGTVTVNVDIDKAGSKLPGISKSKIILNIKYVEGKLQPYTISYDTFEGRKTITIDNNTDKSVIRTVFGSIRRQISFNGLKSTEQFTDLEGNNHNNYTEYIIKSNAIMSDHFVIRDENGKLISNAHPNPNRIRSHKLNIKVDTNSVKINKIEKELVEEPRKETTIDLKPLTNVQDFVNSIEPNNPYNKVFRLLNALNITFNPVFIKGAKGYASYNNTTKVVSISDKFNELPELEKIKLLAHESIHNVVNPLATPEDINKLKIIANKFTENLDNSDFLNKFSLDEQSRLLAIRDIINKTPIEVITYAFTLEVFAKALSEIQTTNKDNVLTTLAKELYDVIVFLINKITNNPTLLDSVTGLLDEMLLRDNTNELFNEFNEMFSEVTDINNNKVNYTFKAVNILLSDKAKQVFDKGNKNKWPLDKILTELAIPKEQKQIILSLKDEDLSFGGLDLRESIITSLASRYSYTVEVNTAKTRDVSYDNAYTDEYGNYIDDKRLSELQKENPTQYYSNLTVPGGTNYTENEISTPLIMPSIKGHAQFSTDKGIGWFRSDDKIAEDYSQDEQYLQQVERNEFDGLEILTPTKTRRILELQSDLFQKGRDKKDLTIGRNIELGTMGEFEYNGKKIQFNQLKNIYYVFENGIGKSLNRSQFKAIRDEYIVNKPESNQNQFLHLLNKDNNWVTFFIKSIIQDSAKKGYEKVVFPKGETAARIEGHETIAGEIENINKQIEQQQFDVDKFKENRFRNSDSQGNYWGYKNGEGKSFKSLEEAENYTKNQLDSLEQKKSELKSQGVEKLKPIEAFYEIKVGNILEKQFGKENVKTITDEYGNEWREVTIDKERDLNDIYLAEVVDINFNKEVGDIIQNNFTLKGTVLDFIKSSDKESREGIRNLINSNRIKFHCK